MQNLMTLSVDRSPQLPLAAAAKGWILKPAALTSGADQTSGGPSAQSPLDAILPPELRSRLFPQEAWAALVEAIPRQSTEFPGRPPRQTPALLFDPLYAALYNLYLRQDAVGIERTAGTFLREHPITPLDRHDPVTQSLFRFFNRHGSDATTAETRALYSSIGHDSVLRYLENANRLADLIKSQILAAHVLGALGSQDYNVVQLLRAMLLFSGMAPYFLTQRTETFKERPRKLFSAFWSMQCYLPAWTFEIDPCAWKKSDPAKDKVSDNPLQLKLAALTRYAEKIASKQQAIIVTSGKDRGEANPLAEIPECNPQGPSDPDCDCQPETVPCLPPDPCCTEINYYVTDLLVLREETFCYKPSDLAYIENVGPGESKLRKHSMTKTIEEFAEEETKVSKAEERDHQVTDRFSLKAEIEKNLSAKLDVTAEVIGTGYKVTAAAGLSMETAQKEARETFREAVDKAVSKIQVDSRKTQSLKVRTENVETNEHNYINATALPFVSKYFWVSQVKKGQVFSYGLRGMVELLISSPAMLYEHLEKLKSERGFKLKKPKHPCITPKDIKTENYLSFLIKYNLPNLEKPPKQPSSRWEVLHFDGNPDTKGEISGFENRSLTIPEGYSVPRFEFVAIPHMPEKKESGGSGMHVQFGGGQIKYLANQDSDHEYTQGADVNQRSEGIFTVSINNLEKYVFDIRYLLKADPVDISDWQLAVYKAVMEKYGAELRAYDEALAEHDRRKDERKLGRHPLAAREIIYAEIKRAAIYMMCDEFERGGIMNVRSEPCGYPEINRRAAGEKTKSWSFFNRAFDWDLMSFRFFDYFRNPACSWPDTFDPADPNFLFNAFRRAGYARVQIPVSPGMEEDALWYINTHQKWGPGGQIPAGPADDRWISVIEEIKHSYRCYQNDREGNVVAIADPGDATMATTQVLLTGTDLYWDALAGSLANHTIDLDTEREIFIDGIAYKIINIGLAPQSPPYDATGQTEMMWIVTLDRVFEGRTDGVYKHAIGAKFVGSSFFFELPTNLVWIGDHDNKCLPSYPMAACT